MWKLLFALALLGVTGNTLAAPADFNQAKQESRQYIYYDRNTVGDEYCGCLWEWTGRSGGRLDLASCGYRVRAQATRAERIEWEHIVPASEFGRQRQCWQQGGRRNCTANDALFSRMEADLHNLAPVVGEVNADRSNFRFGLLPGTQAQHGQCDFRVDFRQRVAQPATAVRGMVARVYFYMADRYGLNIARQQQQLLMAWHRQHPVSDWERERDARIAARMGHHNPFVTGEKTWTLNYRVSGHGLGAASPSAPPNAPAATSGPVHGNRNSRIYHLPHCPSYNAMAERNRVAFSSSAAAEQAGYRLAGNCKP